MSSELNMELERRLVEWSYWVITPRGFPSKSSIVDIGLPINKVRYSKPPYPINDQRADEMNGWINRMAVDHVEYKEAIKLYYCTDRNLKVWQLAQRLNVAQQTFKQRLQFARTWLQGCLSGHVDEYGYNAVRIVKSLI